ncbi:aldo/keto reductase [Sediminibacterium soli]|uniref:aldo/keto reductase n=1 Tax=Sediminibacterium soli TaxID=2698829 RepID=UPI00137A29E0|nr:aldo/keto reductase [Sediminibacterium soli]NCI45955.1 aldo/keto reductase [Sediminibacterium soli]
MAIRKLGSQGLEASQLGLGCMGMSEFYGETDDTESLDVLHKALDLGVNFWDTADVYGPFTNEVLVGKALKGVRDRIVLATKFGILRDPSDPAKRGFSGKPAYVQSACEASLKRLDTDIIDLYYLHRVDPETPIEETVEAMAKLVQQGKVRAIGLSEVSVNTLRRAHAVFPVTAVQSEYSLWTRDPEEGMLDACRELGIAFVAYSPLGRGFLGGQIRKFEDLAQDDYRRFSPRFQGDNFDKNLALVQKVEEIAVEKGCTSSQLAIAWVMAQGDHIFPIPGTKRLKYLQENIGSLNVQLTQSDLERIDAVFPPGIASGLRYPENMMGRINA